MCKTYLEKKWYRITHYFSDSDADACIQKHHLAGHGLLGRLKHGDHYLKFSKPPTKTLLHPKDALSNIFIKLLRDDLTDFSGGF